MFAISIKLWGVEGVPKRNVHRYDVTVNLKNAFTICEQIPIWQIFVDLAPLSMLTRYIYFIRCNSGEVSRILAVLQYQANS